MQAVVSVALCVEKGIRSCFSVTIPESLQLACRTRISTRLSKIKHSALWTPSACISRHIARYVSLCCRQFCRTLNTMLHLVSSTRLSTCSASRIMGPIGVPVHLVWLARTVVTLSLTRIWLLRFHRVLLHRFLLRLTFLITRQLSRLVCVFLELSPNIRQLSRLACVSIPECEH